MSRASRLPALASPLAATAVLALIVSVAAGCGRGGAAPTSTSSASAQTSAGISGGPAVTSPSIGPTGQPGPSGTALPTLRPPTAPPRTPTDLVATDVIVGIVTTGGAGPCYALETDDGRTYALYGDSGTALVRGATVRVWFEPFASNCGPGTQVRVVKVEVVR